MVLLLSLSRKMRLRKEAGSNESADVIVSEYPAVNAFLRSRVTCAHEADDLTQEAFRKLIESCKRLEIRHPRGLLFRIAKNLLIDRSRLKRPSSSDLVSIEDEAYRLESREANPEVALSKKEQVEQAKALVASLPKKCREVFILSRFYHLTYEEISERLGISKSTVEKHVMRGIRLCRAARREFFD